MPRPTLPDRHGGIMPTVSYLLMLTALIGCERTPATSGAGTPLRQGELIVLVGPPASNPQRAGIEGGARLLANRYRSLRLETVTPINSTPAALARVVGSVLSKNPDAICLYVSDATTAQPAAEEILRSGTILVTIGYESIDGTFGHVQVDLTGGAELMGKRLTEIAGGKRSYLLVHRSGANPTATHCYERFMREARQRYGMKLLQEQNAAEAEQPPEELLRAMFARFRHAGLAVTLDPFPWLFTAPGELLGREAKFTTLCAAPALWPALRSGEAAALVGPLDGRIGALAAEMALIAITETSEAGLVRLVECELVTPETLDDFAKRYAKAAGLELDGLLPPAAASQPASGPASETKP